MQNSVSEKEGAMLAILGMKIEEVEKEVALFAKEGVCEISNDNSNSQIVISGEKRVIEKFNENLKAKKKKGIPLSVSAPFHCSLMKNAAQKMEDKIKNTNFSKPNPEVISNVTAKEENDINKIKPLLIDQITSRVRWRESVNYMIGKGVTNFLEIGPGKVLSGLVKKIDRNVEISNINSIEDIRND